MLAKSSLHLCWNRSCFCFVRKESALLLQEESELGKLRFKLGQLLLENKDQEGFEDTLFVIANLFADNPSIPDRGPQRIEIARVHMEAGKKSLAASAFPQATAYLEKGIQLLPTSHWESEYELSLELYSTAAEAEYTLGRYENLRKYTAAVLSQSHRPLLDKRRAYNALLNSIRAQGRMHEGRVLCLKILKQLGVRFPKRAIALHVVGNVVRTRLAIKNSIEIVSKLDNITEPSKVWIMSLLDNLVVYCYQSDQDLLPLVIMRGYQITLRDGLTTFAPVFLALIGFLSVVIGDFKAGRQYAEKSLELLNKIEDIGIVESQTLFMVYQFVLHWQKPAEWCTKPLLQGYHAGLVRSSFNFRCTFGISVSSLTFVVLIFGIRQAAIQVSIRIASSKTF